MGGGYELLEKIKVLPKYCLYFYLVSSFLEIFLSFRGFSSVLLGTGKK